MAAYDDQTECYEVIVPTKRPSSYGRDVSLSFVDVAAIQLAEVPYHVCTDATWSNNLGTQGPVDTFLWFHNPCHEVQSVSVTVSRIMEGVCWSTLLQSLSPSNCAVGSIHVAMHQSL